MKINELTNRKLRRALRATVQVAGVNSYAARALRQEASRRRALRDRGKKPGKERLDARNCPTAWMCVYETAQRKGDHERAAEALRELRRLGVTVRTPSEGVPVKHDAREPQLRTPGIMAAELGVPLPRVQYILATRPHIRPSARAGTLRLYDLDAQAMVRHELSAITARRAEREGARHAALATYPQTAPGGQEGT